MSIRPAWQATLTTGNGRLAVVVDSADADHWPMVDETVFAALQHCGLPYSVLDLSQARLSAGALTECRCVLLAQAHLGRRLGEDEAALLAQAVAQGLGLVALDGSPSEYPAALRQVFGAVGEATCARRSRVRIARSDHFITGTRDRGETLYFAQPVEVCRPDSPGLAGPETLLVTDDNWPALVARPFGAGRVVVWTLHPQVWTNAYFGHARGLDDLFWKGIVWAARKPFVMYAMPPFVTFVLDDASSSYNHFRYFDVFNDHGYIPHAGIYLDDLDKVLHDVQGQDSAALKAKADAGLVSVAAHGFSYDHQIFYDHVNRRAWPDDVLAENFRRYDALFKGWGIQPSRMLNAHFGEIGLNALPYLRERGIEFLATTIPYGQAWFEPAETRRPWLDPAPYSNTGFLFDCQPGAPEFFVTTARLTPRRITGEPLVAVDYLWGHTIFWDEHPAGNDVQGAADQALAQMRRGLDSLFYGELMTHEQRIAVLSMRELDQTLALIDQGLARYPYVHRSYEYISDYARSKTRTRLTDVSVDAGGGVTVDLAGHTTLTTSLYLFTEANGALEQRFVDVPAFEGSARVTA